MSNQLKIVTYNLRNVWWGDGANGFAHRAGFMYTVMEKEQPDIVAFQEVLDSQLKYLERMMPDYLFVGHGRDANLDGEGLYTAFKKDVFMLCGLDVFWISPKPYTPATVFEGLSPYPRICINTLLRHKDSGRMLHVYNLHLDYELGDAQAKAMAVVLDKMAEDQQKVPAECVLLGDFNDIPTGKAITYCRQYDKLKLVDITAELPISVHDYGKLPPKKIDYIFTTKLLAERVEHVKLWDQEHSGIFLSDHYPVCAVINF